jgi:CRISPR-associated endonuclease/helicase Cas3
MSVSPFIELYAHTPNAERKWHKLESHLQSVAEQAQEFAAAFDAGEWGKILGQLHDIGKANPLFQDYLRKCATAPDHKLRGPGHSIYGALMACHQKLPDILLFALLGHHAGLPDKTDLKQALRAHQALPDWLNDDFNDKVGQAALPPWIKSPAEASFFTRMLFSTLVDADYLDTEVPS